MLGCNVGSRDAQCGATLFLMLLFVVLHILFPRKQEIVEELRKARDELWIPREKLRHIRLKEGKRAISVKDVLAEPRLAQRLQHPFVLAKTSGMTWTYQNRDDLQNGLCEVFEKNYTAFVAKVRDKQALPQPIICAGLGMGKSRALMMVPKLLADKTEDKTVFTFNVPFENGPTYNSEFESVHMSAVLDRICYHLLGFTTDTLRTFRSWNDKHRADFTLDELVEGLCKHFGKEEQYPTNVVSLLIDGVHNLVHDELRPGGNTEIRFFLRDVMLACQIASPHFVFSVCTMTARKTAVDALQGSSVVPCYLQLPPVTTRPETLPKAVSDKLFQIVKGFGRAVEVLCDVAKDHPERVRDDPGLLIAVCDQIRVRYTGMVVSVEEQTMLLRYALLKKPVNEDTDLAAHLYMGLMSLRREGGKTYLGLSLIWAIVNSIGRPGSLLEQYNFTEKQDGGSFESFVQWYRCVLSKLYDTGPMNVVYLHKGVQWLNKPSDRTLTDTPLAPRCAARRTETQGSKLEQKLQCKSSPKSHINEGTPSQGFAFQNALGAPHDKGVNEVSQVKHYTIQPFPKHQKRVIRAIKVEVEKSVNKTDVFLWHTIATFPEQWVEWCKQDDVLKDRIIGVVDATSFEEYYNFFAPLWLHSKQKEEPNSSVSSRRKRKHTSVYTSCSSSCSSSPKKPEKKVRKVTSGSVAQQQEKKSTKTAVKPTPKNSAKGPKKGAAKPAPKTAKAAPKPKAKMTRKRLSSQK